jgi:hypothetical protein
MKDNNRPNESAGAPLRMPRVALVGPLIGTLLGALLGGCGAGTADNAALPLGQSAPAIAATHVSPLPAQAAPAEMLEAAPAPTLPTPADAAVGADAGRDALRVTAKSAAPSGRRAASPPRSPSISLSLDADVGHPIVVECIDPSGAVTTALQPSIQPCPEGDALPPAPSSSHFSSGSVVDPTAGRHAGVLPRSR